MGARNLWTTAFVLLVGCVFAAVDPSKALPEGLTPETFAAAIAEGLTFIDFFSPYCSHCQTLAPVWTATYVALQPQSSALGVSMRQVDCSKYHDFCKLQKIAALPAFRLYDSGSLVDTYPTTGHEQALFITYLTTKSREKQASSVEKRLKGDALSLEKKLARNTDAEVKKQEGNAGSLEKKPQEKEVSPGEKESLALLPLPEVLTNVTFFPLVSRELVLVEFFSPLCGHCIEFAPIWKKIFTRYAPHSKAYGISLRQFNCDKSREFCDAEGVKNYPQFRLYGPGDDGKGHLLHQYPLTGKREEDSFWEFLLDHSPNKEALMITGRVPVSATAPETTKVVASKISAQTKRETGSPAAGLPASVPAAGLPPFLTGDTFDQEISRGVVFVEYVSRFSAPSRAFGDQWQAMFKRFSEYTEEYGVLMRQVDCIESAQLCQREGVTEFPLFAVYGPDGAGKGRVLERLSQQARTENDYFRLLFKHSPHQAAVQKAGRDVVVARSTEKVKAVDDFDMTGMPVYLNAGAFDTLTATELVLVEFFSPYCSHCKEFFPTYKKIFQAFEPQSKAAGLLLRQVNCIESGDLCSREKIMSYPQFKLYGPDTVTKKGRFIEKFPGPLNEKGLLEYIAKVSPNKPEKDLVESQKEPVKEPVKEPRKNLREPAKKPENNLGEPAKQSGKQLVEKPAKDLPEIDSLTLATFDEAVGRGLLFVKFYSPYCGACMQISPIWLKSFENTVTERARLGVQMAKVNCVENGNLCAREKITGYPRFRVYESSSRHEEYKGERTEEGFSKLARGLSSREFKQEPIKVTSTDEKKAILVDAKKPTPVDEKKVIPLELAKVTPVDENKVITGEVAKVIPVDEKKAIAGELAKSSIEAPKMLTLKTFSRELSKGLTLVEFYSPYCHHCMELAPIWMATHERFGSEGAAMGIKMRQVNCVEEADLCGPNHEDIRAYPSLHLYGPSEDGRSGQFLELFPLGYKRTMPHLIKYMREAAAEFSADNMNLPSKSTGLGAAEMLSAIAGDVERPIFVSFWPATDAQLQKSRELNRDMFLRCPECHNTRRMWDRLSNAQEEVPMHHFNCGSHPTVCRALGLEGLSSSKGYGAARAPKMIAFLPRKVSGLSKVEYDYYPTTKDLLQFMAKLRANYRYSEVTPETLERLNIGTQLPVARGVRFPLGPANAKVAFVYHYDAQALVPEDFQIMGHMLEKVMELPFEISLFKATGPQIPAFARERYQSLASHLTYPGQRTPHVFDPAMYQSLMHSALPSLYCFKENSLVSFHLQNFDPREMRDVDRVKAWMETNGLPAISPLKPTTYHYLFTDERVRTNDKVVVAFVDSEAQTPLEISAVLRNVSMAENEYRFLKDAHLYRDITNQREIKDRDVAAMRVKNPNADVSKRMRREISHGLFGDHNLHFVFLDLAHDSYMVAEKGWNVFGLRLQRSKYQYLPGDVIIVDKNNKRYVDAGTDGRYLTADCGRLRLVLERLLAAIPTSVAYPGVLKQPLPFKLAHSPYRDSLRFMDRVHRHGFGGYMAVVACVVAVVACVALRGSRGFLSFVKACLARSNRDGHYGILGKPPAGKQD